ncbi:MAG: undecaprenyldiphospho-muramoylpentapeptide beta-N-acetylglucosaminyltransferase [Deltaproteobacteria bacterium]|nr:undecaprenyldiphospho-muramoylpentapeptide beta-N-acetylglucosaminyltransferase [Deltaproteobacteria bacterium]
MRSDPRILIAAGGTGGHVMPAATVAGEIKKIAKGADFLFVGVGRPAEANILGPLGYAQKVIKVTPLAGKSPIKAAMAFFSLLRSLIQAMSIVRDYKPDLCLAFGGYVCGPVGLAAKMFGLPLALHEQNSAPGLTNRWLARVSDLAMLGFAEAGPALRAKRVELVGNPVREAISALALAPRALPGPVPAILAVGGSQGARNLNLAVMDLAGSLKARNVPFRLTHQTGAAMEAEVRERYRALGIEADVLPFIGDMAAAYAKADLAIARAGALTLAELVAARLPALLVPLPTAAGDHQTANARALENLGLARLVPEAELASGTLTARAMGLLAEPGKLLGMSGKAATEAAKAAAVGPLMARLCLGLLGPPADAGEGKR